MRCKALILVMIAGSVANAQMVIDPATVRPEFVQFEPTPGEKKLGCEVKPIKPDLNFSFRFQSGYIVRVPMRQYLGAGHSWATALRVTPKGEDASPVYLGSWQRLPEIPKTDVTFEMAGGFLVGEGEYEVDWVLVDDANRVCRKSWKVKAKRSRKERELTLGMAPGTVDDVSLRRSRSTFKQVRSEFPLKRYTVLLHAAPITPWRTRLRAYDRVLLLSSLSSLLERLPAASVRVVAFSLDQQRHVFEQDHFTRRSLSSLDRVLSDIELGVVDYGVLKNPEGHVDLVADLVNRELSRENPVDAVIVLGPSARYHDKVPKSVLEEREDTSPPFFFFQYKPNWFRRAEVPDTIALAMKRIGGRISTIRTPADFGRAINQLAESLSPRQQASNRPR